jgi:hypothetical protein
MIDPTRQLNQFLEGVRLLGGQRAAASVLGINERTMRRICAGDSPLHAGFFRDMATALLDRANHCRELEREIASLFGDNPTSASPTL